MQALDAAFSSQSAESTEYGKYQKTIEQPISRLPELQARSTSLPPTPPWRLSFPVADDQKQDHHTGGEYEVKQAVAIREVPDARE